MAGRSRESLRVFGQVSQSRNFVQHAARPVGVERERGVSVYNLTSRRGRERVERGRLESMASSRGNDIKLD